MSKGVLVESEEDTDAEFTRSLPHGFYFEKGAIFSTNTGFDNEILRGILILEGKQDE